VKVPVELFVRGFRIPWLGSMGDEPGISLRVIGKRVFDLLGWRPPVHQVRHINESNLILRQDVINMLGFVYAEDIPIWVYAAAGGTQNHVAAWMGCYPV
jgi:hypothetical protein